ncbi:hypothetical protein O6R08_07780 [Cutibacterium equinum]|uniref:Integrase catalytic domain-containing protein n=1 Tax=Cutibacterium equinum TaxID=3016342 RepID=A0ABY7QWH5_9ACTN|nr:DDE-type integrase/transposase/recombinase [Cutibacterium equinum]WCC79416.1 hypothetical protein O6R08_07780 [Cutibacterium equinum]
MRTELVEDALKAACAERGSISGAILHSDHGSVDTSMAYVTFCRTLGVAQFMDAVGTNSDHTV